MAAGGIFPREAVLRGSFDKFAESTKLKRGTAEVDTAFLAEIESWREPLARNFALRNDIGQRDLNFAVQRTIDRLIFLRMCEDRGIEPYGQLMTRRPIAACCSFLTGPTSALTRDCFTFARSVAGRNRPTS